MNFYLPGPTEAEREWAQWREETWRQALYGFALKPEEIGSTEDTNHCRGQAQLALYEAMRRRKRGKR